MTAITVRGADASQALAEAMRRLGPEALILGTRQVDGRVEITATVPDAAAPAPPSAQALAPGFSAQLLRRLAAAPTVQGILPPNLPLRVVLAGPPGSGVSMLAARLAAAALRCDTAPRPRLMAPRAETVAAPGRLAAWARLMGLVPDRPLWRPGQPAALPSPHPGDSQILDLSDVPGLSDAALAPLVDLPGAALWLVLPAGLHPAQHDRLVERFFGRIACLALTRTDLCPPTPEDLALPGRFGLPVALHARGPGLIDALMPCGPVEPAVPPPLPEPNDAAARLR